MAQALEPVPLAFSLVGFSYVSTAACELSALCCYRLYFCGRCVCSVVVPCAAGQPETCSLLLLFAFALLFFLLLPCSSHKALNNEACIIGSRRVNRLEKTCLVVLVVFGGGVPSRRESGGVGRESLSLCELGGLVACGSLTTTQDTILSS